MFVTLTDIFSFLKFKFSLQCMLYDRQRKLLLSLLLPLIHKNICGEETFLMKPALWLFNWSFVVTLPVSHWRSWWLILSVIRPIQNLIISGLLCTAAVRFVLSGRSPASNYVHVRCHQKLFNHLQNCIIDRGESFNNVKCLDWIQLLTLGELWRVCKLFYVGLFLYPVHMFNIPEMWLLTPLNSN